MNLTDVLKLQTIAFRTIRDSEREPEPTRKMASIVANTADAMIATVEDSCTPRPPKPEWFGTGPGQWDAWWVNVADPDIEPFIARAHVIIITGTLRRLAERGVLLECVPVARKGFPAPVGWHVVGG